MIGNIVNVISAPKFQDTIQNTVAQVSIETGLKAVGRPLFTLADKNADKETRKYSAAKELLYQILCLGIYLAVIPPIFKKGGFKLVKKFCDSAEKTPQLLEQISTKNGKNVLKTCNVNNFKNEKGILEIYKLGNMSTAERGLPANKDMVQKACNSIRESLVDKTNADELIKKVMEEEQGSDFFRQFYMAKGGIEISSIIGSVIGLTVLAPEVSHLILHPILHAIGLEAPKKEQPKATEDNKVNIKA